MDQRNTRSLAIGLLVLFFLSAFQAELSANQAEELRSKIDQRTRDIQAIEQEIAKFQAQIDAKSQEANTLKNQIAATNISISKLKADINLTERKIEKTEYEIQRLMLEIAVKETDIVGNKKILAEIIRQINEAESQSMVEVLLANEQISDFFSNLKYIEDLENGIGTNLETLRQVKSDLEQKQSAYREEKAKLAGLKNELGDRKEIAEDAKDNLQAMLKATKNKEAEYQKLAADKTKERDAILQEIASIEDELRKLINPNSLPPAGRGVLAWPVQNPIITQEFGFTSFAKSNSDIYGSGGHNGIDLKASVGTPIFSAGDGVVLKTGNSDLSCPGGSYGKWVLIEHPNNLATLYAHLSLIKAQDGQAVQKGELIGYSGRSGYATGPHLHFTVYAAGSAGEIRFGPSKSGRCDFLPYGGYLNPMDYL